MDMRLVQVNGYQLSFRMSGMQYTTMTNCTAENCTPMDGESICYAFDFVNPYCIVMNTCATEFVKGGQLRVSVQETHHSDHLLLSMAFCQLINKAR